MGAVLSSRGEATRARTLQEKTKKTADQGGQDTVDINGVRVVRGSQTKRLTEQDIENSLQLVNQLPESISQKKGDETKGPITTLKHNVE